MKNSNPLGHPLFLFSLLALIVNDWYLKAAYPNALTGKISDFAGLFAFPYFFSALFPKQSANIHLLTVALFLCWKSPFILPFIQLVNNWGIPINRTEDYSDYIALISVALSFYMLKHPAIWRLHPAVHKVLIVVACLAFSATSLPRGEYKKYINIDKTYAFDCSKRELVSRFNRVQIKTVKSVTNSIGSVDFDSEANVFYVEETKDTIAILLDYKKVKDQDTIKVRTTFAEIKLSGNDSTSQMTLLTVYRYAFHNKDKDYREKAVKQFERLIVNPIKRNR